MTKITAKTIFFDLDGTLIDTAPDLAFALNTLLQLHQRPTLPLHIIRPYAGQGGKALIKLGFGMDSSHPEFLSLWQNLLNIYSEHICRETQLFPGMKKVLAHLATHSIPWGIVTNKPGWLTESLLGKLGLDVQTHCVVSGDTLNKRKPDPEPLWYACELLQCAAQNSIYIGDTMNDIIAAKRAGMPAVVALYGYLAATDQPESWAADAMINYPEEILTYL